MSKEIKPCAWGSCPWSPLSVCSAGPSSHFAAGVKYLLFLPEYTLIPTKFSRLSCQGVPPSEMYVCMCVCETNQLNVLPIWSRPLPEQPGIQWHRLYWYISSDWEQPLSFTKGLQAPGATKTLNKTPQSAGSVFPTHHPYVPCSKYGLRAIWIHMGHRRPTIGNP